MEDATQIIADKLNTINDKTNNITSVVTTITKVADQTNLLSLNAAIEAEKANEYGKGLAVVAREIRRLADQTVKGMQSAVTAGVIGMEDFAKKVRNSVEEVRRVGAQLALIVEQVQSLTPRFEQVTEGMRDQAQGAQQISNSMDQLNEVTQQTADSVRETNSALEQLTQTAHDLQDEIAGVRIA